MAFGQRGNFEQNRLWAAPQRGMAARPTDPGAAFGGPPLPGQQTAAAPRPISGGLNTPEFWQQRSDPNQGLRATGQAGPSVFGAGGRDGGNNALLQALAQRRLTAAGRAPGLGRSVLGY